VNSISDDERLEKIISVLLRTGLVMASLLVLTGGVIYLYQYGGGLPQYGYFQGEPAEMKSLKGVVSAAFRGESRGIIQLGLLLLIFTPISRVIFSAISFLSRKDYLYAGVSIFVLAVLIFNLFKT
jgi:uncharacterized membrane protein